MRNCCCFHVASEAKLSLFMWLPKQNHFHSAINHVFPLFALLLKLHFESQQQAFQSTSDCNCGFQTQAFSDARRDFRCNQSHSKGNRSHNTGFQIWALSDTRRDFRCDRSRNTGNRSCNTGFQKMRHVSQIASRLLLSWTQHVIWIDLTTRANNLTTRAFGRHDT